MAPRREPLDNARMSRDGRLVLVILVGSLVATAVFGVVAVRHGARAVRDLARMGSPAPGSPRPAGTGLFLYADATRMRTEPPPRFAARLPRVQEFSKRGDEPFPPPAHVKDLLCVGDADMWRRAREAIAASGKVTVRQVMDTYGSDLRYCPGDGCFALELVDRGDPAPAAAPAWMALASCPGPRADAAFTRAGVPTAAVLERARRARWPEDEGGRAVRAPTPERVVAAGLETIREGPDHERRLAAFDVAAAGPGGVEALLALHARERDAKLRHDLGMALSESDDPRAQAAVRAECARDGRDPICTRQERPELPAPVRMARQGPSPALLGRLRALRLLPGEAPAEEATAELLLLAAGCAHEFDTETGQFPNEHDSLLRSLAALAGDPMKGAIFEEIPLGGPDDESPYQLRAYLGGERFEVKARNYGDWYDVEAVIGLLNTMARARQLEVRWLVLEGGDQTAIVVAGPEEGLRTAVAEKLLRAGGAGDAMKAGKGFEGEVLKQPKSGSGGE